MVTTEGNRIQSPSSTPFDRPTQAYSAASVAVTAEPRVEQAKALTPREPFWSLSLVSSGATIGSIAGIGGVVLAIIGLSGVYPLQMMWVASIALGMAFVSLGAIDATWMRLFRFGEEENANERAVVVSGFCTAFTAGLVAAVLGILNITFTGTILFSAIAVLVLGLGLLWHSMATRQISQFSHDITYRGAEANHPNGPFAVNILSMAHVRDFLVGLGGAVLGVLAILQFIPVTLILVAMLALGAAATSTASTICLATLATLENVSRKRM